MSSQAIPSSNHDEWHRVHAQLLKSVADAQAKLLAAQNEITDKLDKLSEYSTYNLEVAEKRINERLNGFNGRLEAMRGVLAGLGASLAELASRQEELAKPRRRIVKRAVERKRRQ